MTEEDRASDGDGDGNHKSNDEKLYHWVYVAGWCIISAIVDFAFLWPETHLWALIALAGGR